MRTLTPLQVVLLFTLLFGILAVASAARWQSQHHTTGAVLGVSTAAPTLSLSNAASYTSSAAALAQENRFRDAANLLRQGEARFPEERNLTLTRQYYETQALAHGQ